MTFSACRWSAPAWCRPRPSLHRRLGPSPTPFSGLWSPTREPRNSPPPERCANGPCTPGAPKCAAVPSPAAPSLAIGACPAPPCPWPSFPALRLIRRPHSPSCRLGGIIEIQCQHPDPLLGGSLGTYHLDLYKQEPGQQEAFVASMMGDSRAADGRFHFEMSGPVMSGTAFRVIVFDPMGRTSPPSAAVTAP